MSPTRTINVVDIILLVLLIVRDVGVLALQGLLLFGTVLVPALFLVFRTIRGFLLLLFFH